MLTPHSVADVTFFNRLRGWHIILLFCFAFEDVFGYLSKIKGRVDRPDRMQHHWAHMSLTHLAHDFDHKKLSRKTIFRGGGGGCFSRTPLCSDESLPRNIAF